MSDPFDWIIRAEIWAVFPIFGGRINLPIIIYTWCLEGLRRRYGGLHWHDYPFISKLLILPLYLASVFRGPTTHFPVTARFLKSRVDFLSLNFHDSHVRETKHAFKASVSVESDTDTRWTPRVFPGTDTQAQRSQNSATEHQTCCQNKKKNKRI